MAWTYSQLNAAVTVLSPTPVNYDAAAAAINAQTTTATSQPFLWSAAVHIGLVSPTGDWARIVARSRQSPALPPVTAGDVAIMAAITATELPLNEIIDPTDAGVWPAILGGFEALAAVGDISNATMNAVTALTTTTISTWQPPVTAGDIQTAESQA